MYQASSCREGLVRGAGGRDPRRHRALPGALRARSTSSGTRRRRNPSSTPEPSSPASTSGASPSPTPSSSRPPAVAHRARARDGRAVGQHRARPAVPGGLGVRHRLLDWRRTASTSCSTPSRTRSPGDRPQHRAPFHTFETLRPHIVADPQELWDRVVDLHSLVLGGTTTATSSTRSATWSTAKRATFFDLVVLGAGQRQEAPSRRPRRPHPQEPRPLLARGRGADLRQHEDGTGPPADERRDRPPQRALLRALLVRCPRAPAWSLEHIHAQNSEGLNTVEQWTAWLTEHRKALDALDLAPTEREALQERIDAALPTITSETFEPLHQRSSPSSRPAPIRLSRRPGDRPTATRSTRSRTSRCWHATTTAS